MILSTYVRHFVHVSANRRDNSENCRYNSVHPLTLNQCPNALPCTSTTAELLSKIFSTRTSSCTYYMLESNIAFTFILAGSNKMQQPYPYIPEHISGSNTAVMGK